MRFPLLILSIFATAACAPLTSHYAPVDAVIEVRDADTGHPIADATVYGGVNALFNPDSQVGVLGRPGSIPGFVVVNEPSHWMTRTDSNGVAEVQIAGGNPTSLTIVKPGYARIQDWIGTGSTGRLAGTHWRSDQLIASESAGRTLEYRIIPSTDALD